MADTTCVISAFLRRVERAVARPGDSAELRDRKLLLVISSLLFTPPGMLWAAAYWLLGERDAAPIPFSYVVATTLSLLVFARTKRFELTRDTQLALILVLPFALQLVLGGFVPSSGVVLWLLLA